MITNEQLQKALDKPEEELTDEEFDAVMYFENWCKNNEYRTHRRILKSEAFEIFRENLYDLCIDKMSEDEAHFKQLLWDFKKWTNGDSLDIPRAKRYPIKHLIEQLGIPMRQNKIKSIFNPDERTSSLHIYEKTNSYYDFATNKGGDVIDFLMNYKNIGFVEAVKMLT